MYKWQFKWGIWLSIAAAGMGIFLFGLIFISFMFNWGEWVSAGLNMGIWFPFVIWGVFDSVLIFIWLKGASINDCGLLILFLFLSFNVIAIIAACLLWYAKE